MSNLKIYSLPILIFFFFLGEKNINAFEFDPENVITDKEMTNPTDLTCLEVQRFLLEQGSGLARYKEYIGRQEKSAAEIICSAAEKNNLSKKVLLVMLQKEQGLITNPNPSEKALDWAMGFGVCDGCSLSDANVLRWKGFSTQIFSAAEKLSDYLKNSRDYRFFPGKTTSTISGSIEPQNKATAALYIYSPHVSSVLSFARIWNIWFGDGTDVQRDKKTSFLGKILKKSKPKITISYEIGDDVMYFIPKTKIKNRNSTKNSYSCGKIINEDLIFKFLVIIDLIGMTIAIIFLKTMKK